MSLHALATNMASKGRNGDSMLVHMTPGEVHGLQALAMKHGGSLTINPDTGLPEANFLKSLLPMLAGFALNAFVPGLGTAIGGALGTSAAVGTGIAVGGITGLATGSLSKGLMAGLGAYGGAGLSEGLLGAGAASGAGQTIATEAATQAGLEGITLPADYASLAAKTATPDQIAAARAAATPGDLLSAGAKSVGTDPMAFAKQNWKPIAAASLPILSEIGTTTKASTPVAPGRIREKRWDGRQFVDVASTDAGVYNTSGRSFSDLYRGYNNGGIVALAEGGDVIRMAKGTPPAMLTDEQLYQQTGDWNKAAALRDAQNVAVSQYNATNNPTVGANINQWIVDNPFATAADINTAITKAGLTQDIVNPYLTANTNISDATRYALSHANEMPGSGGLAGMQQNILKGFAAPNLTQAQIDTEQRKYGISDADIQSPLTHGYQIADTDLAKATNYLQSNPDVQAWLSSAEGRDYIRQHPEFDASDIAYTHYMRYGKGEGRTWEEAAKKPIVCGPGFRLNAAGTACEPIPIVTPPPTPEPPTSVIPTGFYGNNTGNPLTSTPGDITSNRDGTVTVQPNIPGRPEGGFPGMASVRDAYTAGGGSLGYTAPVPKTAAEHDRMYNKLTDDSLDAYNFLMGKGKNLTQVNAAKGRPLMQPYFTGANRYKPKFLSYDKDGQVVSSGTSGKPADAKVADLTKAKTIEVVDSSGYNTETYTAVLQEDGSYLAGNGKRYDVTGKQIAAGGGMMGYAMGGGLGSLGSYSDGGRLLKGPGDGVSDSIPATIGAKQQPARLADGEFVIPARIVSELGNGSTDAGAKKLYAMMDRVQKARGKTTGKNKVAANSRADKHLPA